MRRYFLRKGDRSTSGGVIVDGFETCHLHGVPMTYVGAKVDCPACRSVGFIEAHGIRHNAEWLGEMPALEGDLCRCNCPAPPGLVSSQRTDCQEFPSFCSADLQGDLPETTGSTAAHEWWIAFKLDDFGDCRGRACRAHFLDGTIQDVFVDDGNVAYFERPNGSASIRVELRDQKIPGDGSTALLGRFLVAMGHP